MAGEISVTTLDIGGTNVTATATELNLLDGVSGLVQADFTKLAAVDSTAAELKSWGEGQLTCNSDSLFLNLYNLQKSLVEVSLAIIYLSFLIS